MKYFLFFLLFGLVACGRSGKGEGESLVCIQGSRTSDSLQVISLHSGLLQRKVPISEIIDTTSVEFVLLEMTDESLVGDLSTMGTVKVRDGKFYIKDEQQQAIVVFSEKGKYLGKLNAMGRGPEEYHEILDFDVVRNEIAILDYSRVLFYDAESFEFLRSKLLYDFMASRILADSLYYYFHASNTGAVKTSLIVCDTAMKIRTALMESGYEKYKRYGTVFFCIPTGQGMLYHQDRNDTLFRVTDSALVAAYAFDFGGKRFKDDYMGEQRKPRPTPEGYFSEIGEFCYADSVFTFYVNTSRPHPTFAGVYSLRSGVVRLFNTADWVDDLYHLAVRWWGVPEGSTPDGYFYTVIRPSFLSLEKPENLVGTPLEGYTLESNPVIVKFKFKEF